jgi:transglutaminase-like putative cysteine protease
MNRAGGEGGMFFNRIKRPVAGTVLVTFLSLTLQPLSVLAQDRPTDRRAVESGEEKFSRTLNDIHEILKEVAPAAAMPHMKPPTNEKQLRAIGPNMKIEVEPAKPAAGVDVAKKVADLRAKAKELASLEQHVRAGFDDTAKHIKDKNLPAEIMARHEEALRAYEARAAEFRSLMNAVDRAGTGAPLQAALTDLATFMAKYPNQKTHTPSDPNNLPWGSPKPVTREPYTSPSQFRTSGLFGEPIRLAQAGSLSGISLPTTVLPATPVPADTAPTEDVQITQPIRDLAASLNNNPVQIYNWVRNNIEFIPSYGSIQGSDMTLQIKRGNAFDTASLLIALFRAADIPARYVYGTVEAPADKVMNWVGGVTVPQAAINLMGQGGIPVIGITQSGQVRSVRMEHVWVEAFVDYVPSRGAVNRSPDTWVALDASFKQYQYAQGMDIRSNVAFDTQALVLAMQQGATANYTDGWVQNINQTAVLQALSNYETAVTAYVQAQKPDATVGDVMGTRTIVQENRSILLGTLPYTRIATGPKLQSLPDNLRWKFQYSLFVSEMDRALDSPAAVIQKSTASLAGRKITLSFTPASSADQTTINSYLPRPHSDGTPVQVSELPSSLPGYLIRLIPELRIDGDIVASASPLTMGTELIQRSGFFDPARGWVFGQDNYPTAGEYVATAIDLHGIATAETSVPRNRLTALKTKLDQLSQSPTDPTPIDGVTKEQLVGDVLYGALQIYFGSINRIAHVTAKSLKVASYRMPSFGNFGISATTVLSFGVPRAVRFGAVGIDIDRIYSIDVAYDASDKALSQFRKTLGSQYSAQEHVVPEQLFADPNPATPVQAVSAIKAIAVAAGQGQRIYALTSANAEQHASILSSLSIEAAVKQEIANAVAIGMEATVHSAPVSVGGLVSTGYIITDPQSGAGAYKISGGLNGGKAATFWGTVLTFLAVALAFLATSPFLLIVGSVAAIIATILLALTLMNDPIEGANFAAARALMLIFAILLFVIVDGFLLIPITIIGALLFALLIAVIMIVRAMSHVAMVDRPSRFAWTEVPRAG